MVKSSDGTVPEGNDRDPERRVSAKRERYQRNGSNRSIQVRKRGESILMKAVIFDLDALVQKGSPTPLLGVSERLAVLRAQGIPIAVATNPAELIGLTVEQEEQALDSVTATARVAANIKEIIQGLGLQQVPWFVSLGDPASQETMSSVRYQSM